MTSSNLPPTLSLDFCDLRLLGVLHCAGATHPDVRVGTRTYRACTQCCRIAQATDFALRTRIRVMLSDVVSRDDLDHAFAEAERLRAR